jgi:phospholipid/cholesterol/gamma-HCH transport system substrate-binding protein
VVVLGTGSGDTSGTYKVRAIFSNAFTVIPGEDVKISGVKVGKIDALDVTPDNKAAVVLDITEPGFQDFRKDATCTIRPQSLIGERFVECTPTQPRADGEKPPPELNRIQSGPGKGQYLLPATQTIKPVDIDLVGNIMRLPYRQRLSIIINELGTGLAANGQALRQAVREANPALQETDKVLAIIADQNKTLAALARNGDTVLRPLARDRQKVADFIDKANTTAVASAQRRTDIERNLQKFPAFLQQLKPTMQRLGGLADQMTPVLTDLGAAAPDINRFIEQLGPFSQAGLPALQSLGDAADAGDQALLKSKPIIGDVRNFAAQARPLTKNLSSLLTSLRDTGGIERLMDFLYYQAAATNGYDSIGHYLRAVLVVTTCSTYQTTKEPQAGCSSKWPTAGATSASASAASAKTMTVADVKREIAGGRSPYLAREDGILNGLTSAELDKALGPASLTDKATTGKAAKGKAKGKKGKKGRTTRGSRRTRINLPAALLPGAPASGGGPAAPAASQPGGGGDASAPSSSAPSSGSSSGGGQSSSTPSSSGGATQTLLDYLLGG